MAVERTPRVTLRDVTGSDIPVFFAHQSDGAANLMAAFDSRDRAEHDTHWAGLLRDETVVKRTILADEEVAGNAVCYGDDGSREVGYWLGREFWGQGIATAALRQFLELVGERPLRAHVAADNAGSIRVLEKCGFTVAGEDRGYARVRGALFRELVMELRHGMAEHP